MLDCATGVEIVRRWGNVMEYEDTGAKRAQLVALLMTVLVVGGAIIYAM